MKINKDLVDAIMMLSFIILVLVGTTDFESLFTKEILMGVLGFLTVAMVALRLIRSRQKNESEDAEHGFN